MGRRALRKIDPALDLTGYLLDWEQLPRPFSPLLLFQRSAPLEIEVGSGKGLFLSNASAAHPERDYLGIERARKYACHAAARLAKSGRANARLLCGDAWRAFAEWFPDSVASAVHIYFPDPWWKKRHQKRRLLVDPFLADVERVLAPGGSLHFWTDVQEYYQTSLARLSAATSLDGPLPVAEQPAQHHLDYRTHFERRVRLHEQPVYRAEFRKSG